MWGDNIMNRMRTLITVGLALVVVLLAFSATPEGANHRVTISGSGSGDLENPKVGGGGVGLASCTVDINVEEITCQASIYNIVNLRAAHLHVGGMRVNGPVAIAIPDLPVGVSGAFGQSFTLRGTDLIQRPAQGVRNFQELAFACAAGNCYLNYHTAGNPGGEIRVQLCPSSAEANTFNGIALCTNP